MYVQLHTVPSRTTLIYLFLLFSKLHVSINVDHHRAFCTNPQKQAKILLFVRLLKYYNIYIYMGKPEGKRPLGRPRRRWVDNIRMDLQDVGCGYGDWIGLAQDRDRWRTLVSAVMNLRVP